MPVAGRRAWATLGVLIGVAPFATACAGAPHRPADTPVYDTSEPTPFPDTADSRSDAKPPSGNALLVIHKQPMMLGAKSETKTTFSLTSLYTAATPNGTVTVEQVERSLDRHTVELMAIIAGTPRSIRVRYEEKETSNIVNGRETRKVSPVAGKTFVVGAAEGGVRVSDGNEHAVPMALARIVASDFRALGTREAFVRAMPDELPAAGTQMPSLAEALKDDVHRTFEGRVFFGKVSVAPASARTVDGIDCVAFSVALQVGFEKEGNTVRMNLHGELLIRAADGWLKSSELSGPIRMDLSVNGVAVRGTGHSQLQVEMTYP